MAPLSSHWWLLETLTALNKQIDRLIGPQGQLQWKPLCSFNNENQNRGWLRGTVGSRLVTYCCKFDQLKKTLGLLLLKKKKKIRNNFKLVRCIRLSHHLRIVIQIEIYCKCGFSLHQNSASALNATERYTWYLIQQDEFTQNCIIVKEVWVWINDHKPNNSRTERTLIWWGHQNCNLSLQTNLHCIAMKEFLHAFVASDQFAFYHSYLNWSNGLIP